MIPGRFTKIDASNRHEHSFLSEEDKCLFVGERTSGQRWDFSETNQLISNLKKKPSTRGTPQWRYKLRAIRSCAEIFAEGLNPKWIEIATLVPVPPSKAKTHPEYDDRILKILEGISVDGIDVRELVRQKESMRAAHESPDNRPSIDELASNYEVDEDQANPPPRVIGIVDDVLTTGRHFKAMQRVLTARFPAASIVGLFIARTIRPNPIDDIDFPDF